MDLYSSWYWRNMKIQIFEINGFFYYVYVIEELNTRMDSNRLEGAKSFETIPKRFHALIRDSWVTIWKSTSSLRKFTYDAKLKKMVCKNFWFWRPWPIFWSPWSVKFSQLLLGGKLGNSVLKKIICPVKFKYMDLKEVDFVRTSPSEWRLWSEIFVHLVLKS